MRLLSIYSNPDTWRVPYDLLAERPRENWISHERMPTWGEHVNFIGCQPFRLWFAIEADVPTVMVRGGEEVECPAYVGAIEVTLDNEIGVAVLQKYRGNGFGRKALKLFLGEHQPLPAIPAVRNGHWLANISVKNEQSKQFFKKLGFKPLQETWVRT